MSDRPTPETDAEARSCHAEKDGSVVPAGLTRQLERQRDEAIELVAMYRETKAASLPAREDYKTLVRQRDELLEALEECLRSMDAEPKCTYWFARSNAATAIASVKGGKHG